MLISDWEVLELERNREEKEKVNKKVNETDHTIWWVCPYSKNIPIKSWEDIPREVSAIINPQDWR